MIFETERLYCRNLTPEDAQSFYDLNDDPKVLKYTGDEPFKELSDAKCFLKNYKEYDQHGFGRWAVIRKSDHTFLGWCGLKYHADIDRVDLGFRFFRKFWNQGYASESSLGVIDYAFTQLGLNSLMGRVEQGNDASIHVLQKLGFKLEKKFDFDGKAGLLFTLNKA